MPGRPSVAGRSLLVSRPAGRMGGGGSALRVCADHRGGINWLSLSPDGQRLLTGSEDGTARLWSTADGQCCALLQGHESYVTFCQLEDEAAFTCSADRTIRKWDVRTGQCLQVFRGHTSIVNRILVANNQLFSSSYDRTARAWSVDKGQVAQEFRGHRNCVLTLAYSAPWDLPGAPCAEEVGGLLVTGSTDGTAKVWQVASGCCHQTLRGHTGAVLCLVLDTPSHTAFTGSTDATIRAWDILSGEQLRVFREHQGSVICLELVNRHVYSGSADRTVKCWLADTGECVRTFAAHRHSVSALRYHAGTLFTGSGDARARAFDAQSGALQRVFRGHAFVINCIQVWNVLLSSRTLQGEPLQGPCPLDLSTVPFTWGHFHHGCPLLLLLPPGAGNGAPSLPTLTQQLEAKPGPELAFRCESWPLGVSSGAHEARSEPCWGAYAF